MLQGHWRLPTRRDAQDEAQELCFFMVPSLVPGAAVRRQLGLVQRGKEPETLQAGGCSAEAVDTYLHAEMSVLSPVLLHFALWMLEGKCW